MNRVRSCVALATVAWLVAACTTESPSDPPEAPARPAESSDDPSADPDPDRAMDPTADWQLYRERFVTAEGRVVDSGNDGVSHSEGQGYALLFATAFDDRPTFELIWAWTNRHLQVRASDRLFSWQWTATEGVTDTNNATDGDLLIAWALLRAGERWQVPEWLHSAREIAVDVRMSMVLDSPHGLMLRPGAEGFERPSGPGTDGLGLVVNPAYWVFPAFPDLARLDPSPIWHQLTDSGLLLVDAARFGRWQLPPDWLAVPTFPVQASGEPTRSVLSPVTPADGFPPRFGYSAVRIPLSMHWAGRDACGIVETGPMHVER
ncbi:MAG: glycosyl hydrolase family 8, partial [Acidobacteriota bacterium]